MQKSNIKQFGSPRVKFCPSIVPLPSNFADQVLDLEIQIETQSSIDAFKTLMELYSQAIEYYNSIGDAKYKYYQDRMVSFIHKQDSILQAHSIKMMTSPEKAQPAQVPTTVSHRLLFQENPFEPAPEVHRPSELAQKRAAEKVMKQHDFESYINIKQVQQSIKSQNDTLEHRVSTRRRGATIRPRSSSPHSPSKEGGFSFLNIESAMKKTPERRSTEGESDRSGGLARPTNSELFDRSLEEIMEKYILEKIKETGKINKYYKEQISEMKTLGGSAEIINQIIAEMERNRENDLKDLDKNLESKRKAELDLLTTKKL